MCFINIWTFGCKYLIHWPCPSVYLSIYSWNRSLGTLFVPKVLYGILLRNVSVQFSLRQKNVRDHDVRKVSSSCLRYYTNISSQYIWYTQYINETPFCNIQPVDSSRLSRLDHTIRSNLHHRSGINLSLRDVHAIVHCESATAIHHHCRRWYIHDCRCRGFILWPMGPAYYHQMAVN